MTPDTTVQERKPSKVEGIKERSNFLREPIATELTNSANFFTEDAIQLLKFHGSYQQDNRDNRTKGQEKDYRMMLRTRSPGGYIPPLLYLTLDHLANEYGNGTIRATTRQGFQLHGILKQNLKATIAAIVKSMGSTLGACGDLNRNVMSPPAPFRSNNEYEYAREYANRIADLLTPQTGAYYEIWLNGERHVTAQEHPEVVATRKRNTNGTVFPDSIEPIYGTHYLPRKFKVCVTVPGDNSVDLFSQDLSLVVICDPTTKRLQGFNIYAGGGLGRTQNKEETFPRIADPIGYVDAPDVYEAVKAIVATQRDHGNRTDRRQARMKYTIEAMGLAAFKTQVETYLGKSFQPLKPLPAWKYHDFLGWHEQGDGKLFVGISVANGRVKDEGDFKLKAALKRLVQTYRLPMLLTASQNIILFDIQPSDKGAIAQLLKEHGVKREDELPLLDRYAMACPALPMCGLATAEAERVMPNVLDRITKLLKKVGLPKEHFITRMTGCPNGCARPYLAELGFVGNGPDQYEIWLGACPNQTRLSQVYLPKMPIAELENTLEPIFICFKQYREKHESFGDFCNRYGFEGLRAFTAEYEPTPRRRRAPDHRRRVTVRDDIFGTLLQTALERNQSMTDIVDEAIKVYLNITLNQAAMLEGGELIDSDAVIDEAPAPMIESTIAENPAIVEPSQVEPSQVEPSQVEPSQVEPSQVATPSFY